MKKLFVTFIMAFVMAASFALTKPTHSTMYLAISKDGRRISNTYINKYVDNSTTSRIRLGQDPADELGKFLELSNKTGTFIYKEGEFVIFVVNLGITESGYMKRKATVVVPNKYLEE